jgi:iron(III) transport system permease protein
VLFHNDLTRRALKNSLIVAVLGATIGVLLSTLQSYYLQRGRSRLRTVMDSILSLPLGIPGIILGLGFLILLIRTPLYTTLWIILIAYIARFLPLATRGISAMLLAIGGELEESARASGASWWQTLRLIVLPLIKPALVAAWLMLFVIFIRELGATILLLCPGHRDAQRGDGDSGRTEFRPRRGTGDGADISCWWWRSCCSGLRAARSWRAS